MFIVNFNPTDKKCVFTQFLSVCYQIYYVIVVDLFSIFAIKFKRYYLFIYPYIGYAKKEELIFFLARNFFFFGSFFSWFFWKYFFEKKEKSKEIFWKFFAFFVCFFFCGKWGIRTPGPVKINGFQDRRIRPLCQLSNISVPFRKGLQRYE